MANVLVVDDEQPVRDLLVRRLRQWGHEAAAVGSATEALDRMSMSPAAIVFCDVIMPVHDGLWLLERIREQWPLTIVVMVSGAQEMKTVIKAHDLGAVDYVSKPIGRETLYQALSRALAVIESRSPR